ncbi:hypothetical protein E1B28_012263 [Marasmius oreades]|uniref:Uncharacterized protein n=1 Tax=Marasmius oreades TaxID=181124 RepID=A0A9P7UQL1_9AGAR|nr:uncharacterized protein E1B28_012263 [Marasmius oreades]KAG7088249.1 hypothetical protein E1B28_012263 [Marasmius oreades]
MCALKAAPDVNLESPQGVKGSTKEMLADILPTLTESWIISALVTRANDLFGPLPRRVFEGIIYPPTVMAQLGDSITNLSVKDIKEICKKIRTRMFVSPSADYRPALLVSGDCAESPGWTLSFLSHTTSHLVEQQLITGEREQLVDYHNLSRKVPLTAATAGRVFEPILQDLLVSLRVNVPLIKMERQSTQTRTFKTPSLPHQHSGLFIARKPVLTRTFTVFQGVEEDHYLFPDVSNHPLFDAVLVERQNDAVTIWALQATSAISPHRGSQSGYGVLEKYTKLQGQVAFLPADTCW